MNNSGKKPNDDFIIAFFQISADHIKFMKKQQWTITYYRLLLYAAFLGIYKFANSKLSSTERGLLFLATFLISVAGCYFLASFRASISEHRGIINRICRNYEVECKQAGIDFDRSGSKDNEIFITLLASVIGGLVVVAWLFFRCGITQ